MALTFIFLEGSAAISAVSFIPQCGHETLEEGDVYAAAFE